MLIVFAVWHATRAVVKERSEKFWLERDSNPDLYDVGAVLFQLLYQTNWELVITWVNDKPVDSGYMRSNAN